MGGIPVVEVARGGIPVTESDRGVPYEIAANGRGISVRFVSSGGAPFKGVGDAPPGYDAIVIGASGSGLVLRIGSPASWQTPVIKQAQG